MSDEQKPEVEDLEDENGELLPDREAMSVVQPTGEIAPVIEPEHPAHDLPIEELEDPEEP